MSKREKTKKIRDPIYGYIEIEESIVHNIIDTSTFQRLRNIRQTSYDPLYPSALHNRFVHSLGVYYLGCLAFDAISRSLQVNAEMQTKILGELNVLIGDKISRYKNLFELACLLHDVGHSPFSHTGEVFYKTSKSQVSLLPETGEKEYSIHKHLTYLTKDSVFDSLAAHDVAGHEIMSCIVALEAFGRDQQYFQDDQERSFFARCITGIEYDDATDLTQKNYMDMNDVQRDDIRRKMLLNCIIQLLHSSVIDVDRLDYIIRDASTMGYQSVSVDYNRLLAGLELVLIDDYNFTVGFHKNAISVIENAVYAHDNEKKWVQNHPAIIYDSYLLQQSIIHIENKIKSDYPQSQSSLISYDSLTDQGSHFHAGEMDVDKMHIRFLCDADIIFLMKNKYSCSHAEEYFNRNMRRLPVWKSEAEFMHLFEESDRNIIIETMEKIMTNNSGAADSVEISCDTLKIIEEDIVASKQAGYSTRFEFYKKRLQCVESLLALCKKYEIEPNVALLSKSFFKSNFSKETMQNLPILFPGSGKKSLLKDVSSTLSSKQISDGKLIYLFYYPRVNREKIDTYNFSQELLQSFKNIKGGQ